MNLIVEARSLSKVYHSNGTVVHALQGVNFVVERGEFVAVMGPSGSGKSTLLHLLGGLDSPTSGEVCLDGMRVDKQSEAELAVMRRKSVGFMFQFFNLIDNLTVADNIDLPGLLINRPQRELKRRREELLAQLSITDKADLAPTRLSGGEQQRVALARALINNPSVLLADEPTGNLDSKSGAEVVALLYDFHAQGQTVVLVTHDARVASAAERIVFLHDGTAIDEMHMGPKRGQPEVVLQRLARLEA